MADARGLGPARPGRPGQGQAKKRVVVTFEDNRHLPRLLGEYDAHLALVEDRLGIEAHAHGNVVVLAGSEASCQIARDVLEALYSRVAKGDEVGPGDFDGLIRHAKMDDVGPGGQGEITTRRRVVKARTPTQSQYIKAIQSTDLVFGLGPAGTGKTYLAVAAAAHYLERGIVSRVILSRPAVEAGERLGFLPGDMKDKVDPYLRPLYDALYDVLPPEKVERDIETGVIEIAPLAFMRGRTLADAFIILDEAQNATSMQMKMFLTRLGEDAKMVITGDPSQIDLPPGQKSGLMEAVGLLDGVSGIEAIRFSGSDVVRRDLVARIVEAYDALAAKPASLGK
ncbi:MAG: PhoH family protein [Hyphomicrobiaceae bacterium TMED74]|nr:phosphate starvation-inducible protein PhoH [Filomicrobium sp.]RPG40323.1 MAG: PhoH family protein [Hyphomicrobiaceae bacterium TMED74]